MNHELRIYLAGKISEVDWRHHVVDDLGEHIRNWKAGTWWPTVPNAIFGKHGYTGPYYRKVEKNVKEEYCLKPHRLCLNAIKNSTMVFAWIDDPTCYATLFELGYAVALGIHTVVAYPKEFDKSELWFTTCCATDIIEAGNPLVALQAAILRYPQRRTTLVPDDTPTPHDVEYQVNVKDMIWGDPET